MAKLHWMPFYGLDFYSDESVRLMTRIERDIYMELLWCQWREGSLPPEVEDLRRLVRDKVSDRVAGCFPVDPNDGRRRNRKLEVIRQHHAEVSGVRSEAGKLGAKAKQLLKQNDSKSQAIATANGSAKPKQLESELETEVTTPLPPRAESLRASIRETLPEPYRDAFDGFLRSGRGDPFAWLSILKGLLVGGIYPPGYTGDELGQALLECRANGWKPTRETLAGRCQKIRAGPDPDRTLRVERRMTFREREARREAELKAKGEVA